jgi:chromosomal replication initiation ATPase DnaA
MNERWITIVEALEIRGLLEPVAKIVRSHHVTMFETCSRVNTAKVVEARHEVWGYLRSLGFSYPEIGRLWNAHHTTVLAALGKKG